MKKIKNNDNKVFGSFFIAFLLIASLIFSVARPLPSQPAGSTPKWTFVSMSDSQMGYGVTRKILEVIKNDPTGPEFIIHCGDHIADAGNRTEWKTFFKLLKIFEGKMPLYSAPGNHDVNGPVSHRVYLETVKPPGGKTYYSFEHKNAFFVALDTVLPGQSRRIGPEQREWLVQTLESRNHAKSRWTFVFFHIPIFPQGLYKKMNQPLIGGQKIHEIFRQYKVTAVFNGHEHMYNHTVTDGVHYFINGGSGGRLYKGYGGEFNHYIRVNVTDNEILTQAIDLSGKVRDEQRIRKN